MECGASLCKERILEARLHELTSVRSVVHVDEEVFHWQLCNIASQQVPTAGMPTTA